MWFATFLEKTSSFVLTFFLSDILRKPMKFTVVQSKIEIHFWFSYSCHFCLWLNWCSKHTLNTNDTVFWFYLEILSSYRQLRARRVQLRCKDVPLRTRRALVLYKVYGNMVLNGTSLNCNKALLALTDDISVYHLHVVYGSLSFLFLADIDRTLYADIQNF